jgi:hypothetical protein
MAEGSHGFPVALPRAIPTVQAFAFALQIAVAQDWTLELFQAALALGIGHRRSAQLPKQKAAAACETTLDSFLLGNSTVSPTSQQLCDPEENGRRTEAAKTVHQYWSPIHFHWLR